MIKTCSKYSSEQLTFYISIIQFSNSSRLCSIQTCLTIALGFPFNCKYRTVSSLLRSTFMFISIFFCLLHLFLLNINMINSLCHLYIHLFIYFDNITYNICVFVRRNERSVTNCSMSVYRRAFFLFPSNLIFCVMALFH